MAPANSPPTGNFKTMVKRPRGRPKGTKAWNAGLSASKERKAKGYVAYWVARGIDEQTCLLKAKKYLGI